jgi:hypothetical protein
MKRTVAAFIFAPAAAALLFASSAGILVAFVYSYLLSYALGLPVFLVLRRKRKESHVCYLAAGFAMGALYVLVPALFAWSVDALIPALMFGCVGAIVALSFSLLRGNERRRA